ncbi:MAG: M48 family metallopeptidase [Bacteroidales bacterium]|nr:M48 family metallopeptidase [Bacteroidales bacterium]
MNRIAAFAVLAVALCSCGTVALTGRRQLLLYSDSDILSLSDQSFEQFNATAALSTNKTMTDRVNRVSTKLVNAMENYFKKTGQTSYMSGLKWQVELVKSEEVNAFALPSGKIVVYEGLLKYADSEDLLAVVIGHEMAHAIAKHSNERMSQQSVVNKVTQTVEAAAAATGKVSNSSIAVFDAAMGLGGQYGVLLPFSRKQEYEADRIGLILMSMAGYDIEQAPNLWVKMTQAGSSSKVPELLSTHPSDENRIKNLMNCMEEAKSYRAK